MGQTVLAQRMVTKQNPTYVCEVSPSFTDNINLRQFSTICAANDHAISLLNPVTDWDESVVINVAPGKYTEHLTRSHRRIFIIGEGGNEKENWTKPVIIYNTGADSDHYPLDMKYGFNMVGVTTQVDGGGVYGELINKGFFSTCEFDGGTFIDSTVSTSTLTMYFNKCAFYGGSAFKLEGSNNFSTFIALRNSDIYDGTDTKFASVNNGAHYQQVKLQNSMLANPTLIAGDTSLLITTTELYNDGKLTFDTNGFVDIFASILFNGVHFTSDTAMDKKVVNCVFKNTPVGEGDITADVDIEFIEYSGNHQHNGVDGEVLTVSKIKNVGGGQNRYRNIHEALSGAKLQDAIINLEGDVEISEPLVINPNLKIQIDGNKKWSLHTTHATTLIDITDNQCVSFVNMKAVTGGKVVKIDGTSACFSMVSCGRYTNPCYVNIEIAVGDADAGVYLSGTTNIGTSAPVIKIMDVDPNCMLDRSSIIGAVGYPAVEWTVEADHKFESKNSTLLHGSGGINAPLIYAGAGKVDFMMYNCGLNATWNPANFNNTIVSANNTVDSGITF